MCIKKGHILLQNNKPEKHYWLNDWLISILQKKLIVLFRHQPNHSKLSAEHFPFLMGRLWSDNGGRLACTASLPWANHWTRHLRNTAHEQRQGKNTLNIGGPYFPLRTACLFIYGKDHFFSKTTQFHFIDLLINSVHDLIINKERMNKTVSIFQALSVQWRWVL